MYYFIREIRFNSTFLTVPLKTFADVLRNGVMSDSPGVIPRGDIKKVQIPQGNLNQKRKYFKPICQSLWSIRRTKTSGIIKSRWTDPFHVMPYK